MSKTLEFIFDFGSPNAYLVYKVLPPFLQRTGAELQITPCLLGGIFKLTGNQPPMLAYGKVKEKMAYEQLEMKRFIDEHGLVNFKFNSHFPVNTLMLMRGALVAEAEHRLIEYVEFGLKTLWEEDLKMDDAEVMSAALDGAGFDSASYMEQMQTSGIKQRLSDNTSGAVKRGVFGVPTFFVGDEMFFGKDRLGHVEQALLG